MKLLLIGDPHVTPSNIPEAERLMDLVLKTINERQELSGVVVLGDMFHTHLVLRLEVVTFWKYWISKISSKTKCVLLSGNHDQVSDNSREWSMSALSTLEDCGGSIVSKGAFEWDNLLFVPHTHDKEKLIKACQSSNATVLFCHQTFSGSQYENGFYAPEGIDQDLIPASFKYIVSGHIHKEQTIGRVWYPGTPKWDSVSDANEQKGIWIWDTVSNEKEFISSESACTPIVSIELNEGDEAPELSKDKTNLLVLKGSSQWIAKMAKKYKGLAKISAKPSDSLLKRISETRLRTFESYAEIFEWSKGVDKDAVLALVGAE